MALNTAILIALFVCLLYYYFTRTFNYWKQRKIPGPAPVPLFGNIKDFVLRKENTGTCFKELYDKYPTEKVIGIYRMMTPCLLVRDLNAIRQIMLKDFDAFPDRGLEFNKKYFGANLFHANEKNWRPLRSRLTPIFTTAKLKHMVYLMVEKGDTLIDYLTTLTAKEAEQNIYSIVQKFTIATISACAFGVDIDIEKNKNMEILNKFDKQVFNRNYMQVLNMLFPDIIKTLNISILPKEAAHFFRNLIKNAVQMRNNTSSNRKDFIDLILELKEEARIPVNNLIADKSDDYLEITDEVIASQAFVFYVAGYETTANAIAFMIYELAMNPHIQEKLIVEIDEALACCNGSVNYDTLSKLPYMKMVINETLRKYPLVEPLQRVAKFDYKIPDTDVTVQRGQRIIISSLGIHRDEKYYPNPDIFDPERFSAQNKMKIHPYAYIPFGLGPRNCIGMRFSKIQSRVCLLKLFSKFRVIPSKNTPETISFDPYRVVLSPHKGIFLSLLPRNN